MKHSYNLAFITGATSGIGEEFARQLPYTTNLILTGRNTEKLKSLQNELTSETRTVEVITADISNPDGLKKLIDAVKDKPIDLFINNAGLGFYGPMQTHTYEQEHEMMHVNVIAVGALAHALCPAMAKNAHAHNQEATMVVVSSVAGFMALPGFATYAATKMFDLSLAEALAEEYKHTPLKIQALCPGPTRTQFAPRSGMPMHGMHVKDVVSLSLNKIGKKRIVIPGFSNKLSVAPVKFLPRALVTFLAGAVIKKTKQM